MLEQFGIRDNFIELGGDSLVTIRIISRVRDMFGVELSLRQFFEEPTIGELARRVETMQQDQGGARRAAADSVSTT